MKHTYRRGLMKGLFAVTLVAATVSCVDYQDMPAPTVSEGEKVQVQLSFGFAEEEDGYTLTGTTRADGTAAKQQNGAFDAQLMPGAQTRAADAKPDALYELHVIQYKLDGTLIGSAQYTAGATTIGNKLTYTLTQADDCQLVVIARGQGNTTPDLGGLSLFNLQTKIMDKIIFDNIPADGTATQAQMNKMPYVLYLPHVKVTAGKLQSIDGAYDARLLLKRLATRLTVNWNVNLTTMSGYALKEVKLCQVPSTFRILPAQATTEWGTTYPSEVSEFVDTYRLTATSDLNLKTKSVWIPANVRGTSARATSPTYRTKENAPTAASYMELVLDNSTKNERLYYRAYLGGVESTDFNLYENKDYNWTVNIISANYQGDRRIQLLDQTPVVSTNLVPTSNCFMMQPGTNICFNPYEHEAGTNGWNTALTTNGTTIPSDKEIKKVEVLWQTKDVGTSGDLVMGYVIDDTHHENLVNLTGTGINNTRIHLKTPQSKGGNAVIVAKNSSGTAVWSWHIWISDYVPARISSYADYGSAQQRTINGTVHKYDSPLFKEGGAYANMVMMDRDLGARKGGFPGITIGDNFVDMDVVNTFGLLYQWGRKDPFFPSSDGTSNEIKVIYNGYGSPVGVEKTGNKVTMATTIQNPLTFYYSGRYWNSESSNTFWNKDGSVAPGKKTIYDPCPKGWKVPVMFDDKSSTSSDNIQKNSIFTNFGRTSSDDFVYTTPPGSDYNKFLYYYEGKLWGSAVVDKNKYQKGYPKGGRLFLIGETTLANKTIQNSVWLSANPERNGGSGSLEFPGFYGHLWGSDTGVTADPNDKEEPNGPLFFGFYPNLVELRHFATAYGWPVRCIQE